MNTAAKSFSISGVTIHVIATEACTRVDQYMRRVPVTCACSRCAQRTRALLKRTYTRVWTPPTESRHDLHTCRLRPLLANDDKPLLFNSFEIAEENRRWSTTNYKRNSRGELRGDPYIVKLVPHENP